MNVSVTLRRVECSSCGLPSLLQCAWVDERHLDDRVIHHHRYLIHHHDRNERAIGGGGQVRHDRHHCSHYLREAKAQHGHENEY